MGKIYAEQGDLLSAEREFKKTLELRPELEAPQFELINLYKKTGKDERIIQVFRDILERNPKNIRAAMELGYYYYKNKMQKESEN